MISILPTQSCTRILKKHEMELEQEELSSKVDEANQTIRALWFENNFLAKKTKKLDAELFQVRAQLERTSSAKYDKMLNFQKLHKIELVLLIMLCLYLLLLMLNLR